MQNIAILGYGKEGHAVEEYFKSKGAHVTIFEQFTTDELANFHLETYDLVFRSPSVPLHAIPGAIPGPTPGDYILPDNLTSVTRYFFTHCPCPIIGVTGTKGKGTTCSMIAAILQEAGRKVHLVGNIGNPAISVLDTIKSDDIVVYELSSFQLWDLDQSPQVAVILRIEPEHLDVHKGLDDYLAAKANIARHQHPDDTCIYFSENPNSVAIANQSPAQHKIAYPLPETPELKELLDHLHIPGAHNRENAQAALLAAEATGTNNIRQAAESALAAFNPLPHHIEFVRTLDNVDYYDDSFSTSYPAMDVALAAFPDNPVVIIAGGKSHDLDLTATKQRLFSAPNVRQRILIGEIAPLLADGADASTYTIAGDFPEAINLARAAAEQFTTPDRHAIVLLSPAAASFDMFDNYYARGEEFKAIVKGLV